VRRPRLNGLLDRGRDVPLTLISAPAGSGKTTLICDWLTTCSCPSVWVSLDEGDSDLAVFLGYFVTAIRSVIPDALAKTFSILQVAQLPPTRVLAGLLVNEIESLRDDPALADGGRLVIVLDDYHLIQGQTVNELLIELLRFPPRCIQLVLVTRSDPALPIASMRARGQVVEIRRQNLRFSSEETKAFLQQATQKVVSDEVVATLMAKTEGWITGLHLVVLSQKYTDSLEIVSDSVSSERYLTDYLLDEVVSGQPQEIQDYLLRTSVLDRLCQSLCGAVTDLGDFENRVQDILGWLAQADLFIVTLHDQPRWYRYHHLFRQFLRNQLARQFSTAQIADLHRRASNWYATNGFVEDAIGHALAAGDEMAVVQIIESNRQETMNQEHWQRLEHWLNLLPRRLVDERPELLLLETWILQKQWRISDLPAHIDCIGVLMESTLLPECDAVRLRGEIDTLRSMISYNMLDGERSLAFAASALQALPMAYSSARSLAWMYHGGGLQSMGDIEGGIAILHEALKEDRFHNNAFIKFVLIGLCFLHWMAADMSSMNRSAILFLKLAKERHLEESIIWAHHFLGCAAYQANDIAAAENEFTWTYNQRYLAHGHPFTQSAYGLASIYMMRGEDERANAVVESVLAYGLEINNSRVTSDAQAFQAWVALKQGRIAEARRWTESTDHNAPFVPMATFHVAAICLARILVDQTSPSGLRAASNLLSRLREHVEGAQNTRFMIEVLALQALLDNALGDEISALQTLQQTVDLAEHGGLLRVFADLGPNMAVLLTRLSNQANASQFIGQILQAFTAADLRTDFTPATTPVANQAVLVEPLTDRELEVLELLAHRFSAKEIAQHLVISDRTVKRHTANIYQKLNVHSRQEAVSTATALGILVHQPFSGE